MLRGQRRTRFRTGRRAAGSAQVVRVVFALIVTVSLGGADGALSERAPGGHDVAQLHAYDFDLHGPWSVPSPVKYALTPPSVAAGHGADLAENRRVTADPAPRETVYDVRHLLANAYVSASAGRAPPSTTGNAVVSLKLASKSGFGVPANTGESLVRTGASGAGRRLPMNMQTVCDTACKYGMDISDVPITIDKGRAGIAGITWPNGSVTLTRSAFADEEQLARTLFHERFHVDQIRSGMGYPRTMQGAGPWEDAAYAAEETWWATQ